MKRRTLIQTPAIAAAAIVLPSACGTKDHLWQEGDLAIVDTGQGDKPGVCTTVDGGCVNVTLFDGTVCPAHQPCEDFRTPTWEEFELHEMSLMTGGLVTLIQDGKPFARYRLAELPKPITPVVARRMVDHIRRYASCCDKVAVETLDGSVKFQLPRELLREFQT